MQKGPAAADTVVGEGNTAEWKMCGLDKSTSLTVFFDLSASDRSNTLGTVNPQLYLQFITRYEVGLYGRLYHLLVLLGDLASLLFGTAGIRIPMVE